MGDAQAQMYRGVRLADVLLKLAIRDGVEVSRAAVKDYYQPKRQSAAQHRKPNSGGQSGGYQRLRDAAKYLEARGLAQRTDEGFVVPDTSLLSRWADAATEALVQDGHRDPRLAPLIARPRRDLTV